LPWANGREGVVKVTESGKNSGVTGIENLNQDRFMKIADLREAAMEWTVMIEGPDEFGEIQRAQVQIEKGFERLASGEIGLSIDDGKTIMSALQEFVVKQELATYALARRVQRRGRTAACAIS
jgi:hypothetical protein